MPKVSRVKRKKRTTRTKRATPSTNGQASSLSLASEPSTPIDDLAQYSILVFGRPKIGKTTLTACFPKCHHFMFEQGAKALSIHYRYVEQWNDFAKYLDLVRKSDFKTITIDVVEKAFDCCIDAKLAELDLTEIPSNDYGKTHGIIRQAFMSDMNAAQSIPEVGCVYLSHSIQGNRKTAEGDEVEDIHPNVPGGKAGEEFLGCVDILGYYTIYKGRRVLQIEGDDYVYAGHRLQERFKTKRGDSLKFIPMGNSPKEGYDNLLRAFDNGIDPKELDFLAPKRKRTRT